MRKKIILLIIPLCCFSLTGFSQPAWSADTYPDEAGYRRRTAGMLQRIAARPYGRRSQAVSHCPDTGLPVYTWALEGDSISSPYTGRRYVQGPTGYFGPKERDAAGRIIRFGGDPLKHDLPPLLARLLLNPDDVTARAFAGIPGNLNQQYHFAATHWARFYPLLASLMGPEWIARFARAADGYSELRRPSDGARQYASVPSKPHTLVGEPGQLLGGNAKDGGTENHKIMWRTSALLYAQLLPERSRVSGYPLPEAEKLTARMLTDFGRQVFRTGNGEYDSNMYYPHSVQGLLNLYDFSPREDTRLLAKALLDYYLATYALKTINGTLAGARKRGSLHPGEPDEMENLLWAWTGAVAQPSPAPIVSSVHQVTSRYRPNGVIYTLLTRKPDTPFEAQIARPSYHMHQANAYQETFYRSASFALGSVAMPLVDNPAQQVVWSLVTRGEKGNHFIGGGQPRFLSPVGHSPYTQTVQKKAAILVASGQTMLAEEVGDSTEQHRQRHAGHRLRAVARPGNTLPGLLSFFEQAPQAAATWLFVPLGVEVSASEKKRIFLSAENTFICIQLPGQGHYWIQPDTAAIPVDLPGKLSILRSHRILVVPGDFSAFALEAGEKKVYGTIAHFIRAVRQKTYLAIRGYRIDYQSLQGDTLEMQYQPQELRAKGSINGKALDYANWAGGGVYESPYLKLKNGILWVSDGKQAYRIDWKDQTPFYQEALPAGAGGGP